MKTEELIASAERLVKELQGRTNSGGMGPDQAEAKILEMVNWIGDAMVQEAVAGLAEPTTAKPDHGGRRGGGVRAGTEYEGSSTGSGKRWCAAALLPIPRSGRRRGPARYATGNRRMLRILAADDVPDLYAGRGRIVWASGGQTAATLGFKVSSTAVQRATETTWELIPDDPAEVIDEERQQQPCSLMVARGGWDVEPTDHGAA